MFFSLIFFIAPVLATSFGTEHKVRYDGFSVQRIIPKCEESLRVLRFLEFENKHLQFWRGSSSIGQPVDVMIPPYYKNEFKKFIEQHKLSSNELISNVQERIDQEIIHDESEKGFGWKNYHTLEEIHEWMKELSEIYPQVDLIDAGKSYEGRSLLGVHISNSINNSDNAIFIESGIHGNEWITSAVSTFILNELLTSNDDNVKWLAQTYDWYIFPILNPDGFSYAHSTDRMWRKTRRPYGDCIGTDPNRNWDNHWGQEGTSNNSCQENFPGPYVWSENCTRNMADFISTIGDKLVGYIDFHSFSQLLMVPYCWSPEHLDNYNLTIPIAQAAVKSLAKRYGTQFKVGSVYDTIYPASGVSLDWVKATFRTPLVYVYELRDRGKYGFVLPPDQIIPSGQETLDSLVTMFKEYEKFKNNSLAFSVNEFIVE